jgi:hypothetical protein
MCQDSTGDADEELTEAGTEADIEVATALAHTEGLVAGGWFTSHIISVSLSPSEPQRPRTWVLIVKIRSKHSPV